VRLLTETSDAANLKGFHTTPKWLPGEARDAVFNMAAWPNRTGSSGSSPLSPLIGQIYVAEISMILNWSVLH
jgi:hypothetical protein